MIRVTSRFVLVLSIVCASLASAMVVGAQETTIPHLRWRTLDTRYFRFFFTSDAAAWTRDVAARIDGAHDAVAALVGSAPATRVTVIVEDPNNMSNGFALPLLDHPLIFLWPTPPDPASSLGNGTWGDQLSIHEFAHIAHLTRESRNPAVRRLARLLPVKFGPVALHSPRWVTEGYATFVEGRIVRGIGRPHGVWRAAVLRQWAIEGQLPSYGALDESPRFEGNAMAYLAGSAFLEWLASREGDSSVVHLWRRMSARLPRSFDDAFIGVYGAPPDELYGRFTAELTHDALDDVSGGSQGSLLASRSDTSTRPGEGELVQRLRWNTGAPAISRDDSLIAIALRDPKRPPRVVVWSLEEPRADTLARERAERAHALDPEDVPAVQRRPAPLRVLASLGPRGGMSFAEPRFFPDGRRVLLVGLTARGDGVYRGDLYVWNWRTGQVRRVTHGAGIRHGDVSPDGAEVVADRCVGGQCDIVLVDVVTGAVKTWASGSRSRLFSRPRWSGDGSFIVADLQQGGRWRIAKIQKGDTTVVPLTGARASEHTAAFAPDGELVATTEIGGVANIERISVVGTRRARLTDVSGAAIDAEPASNGRVYFLRLHARGLDLARVNIDSSDSWIARDAASADPYPWVTPSTYAGSLDSLPVSSIPSDRSYGLGPREQRLLAGASWASEGKSVGLAYAGTDPIGKLTWLAQGQWGSRASWRGASAGATYRGSRPSFGVDVFALENRPSHQSDFSMAPLLDARYWGASVTSEIDDDREYRDLHAKVLASAGTVDPVFASATRRDLAQITLDGGLYQTPGNWRVFERVGVTGASGQLGDQGWTRVTVTGSLSVYGLGHALAIDGTHGQVSRAIPFEQFALGGLAPPLVDSALLAQRVPMPVLPIGVATGTSVTTLRASLPGPIWRPYYWVGSASDRSGAWSQVVGIEASWHTDGVWMVRVPGVRLVGGFGYSLAGPVRHRAQAYMSIGYRP